MKDYAYLALAVSPFVAAPLSALAFMVGGFGGAVLGSFLLSYAIVSVLTGGTVRLLRDMWVHGIHNDR